VLIGPEGGWTPDEVADALAAGCVPVTLGPRTLRADAAPLVALSVLQYVWGDIPRLGAGHAVVSDR
jgi:16S rRNA (uracil1498-N3)-methyltransferase